MRQSRFLILLVAGVLDSTTARAETIATYPVGTILENIAVAANGDLFVTDLGSGTIFQVSPGGSSRVFGQTPGPSAGIALDTDGTVVAAGGSSFYRFAPDGTPTLVADIAGAGFLNGVTVLRPGSFLVADDTANVIWEVSLSTGMARQWLTSPLLAPPAGGLPIGANGIKLFGGAAYVSNTGAGTILRVPILPDGASGAPEVYASSFSVDDFAFGSDGSIFAATQLGEVIRLRSDGSRTTMATGTLGDAAVAFGRTNSDLQDIYVVNNGGAFLGLPGGPEAASIVRLGTDTTGVAPKSQVVPEPSTLWLSLGSGVVLLNLKRLRSRGKRRSHACQL